MLLTQEKKIESFIAKQPHQVESSSTAFFSQRGIGQEKNF